MLTGGLIGSVHAPTVSVILWVSDADRWPDGWCSCPNSFSHTVGIIMLTGGLMGSAHAPSVSVIA